MLDPNVR